MPLCGGVFRALFIRDCSSVGERRRDPEVGGSIPFSCSLRLAQWIEHRSTKPSVAGSTPASRTMCLQAQTVDRMRGAGSTPGLDAEPSGKADRRALRRSVARVDTAGETARQGAAPAAAPRGSLDAPRGSPPARRLKRSPAPRRGREPATCSPRPMSGRMGPMRSGNICDKKKKRSAA